jgi:hypothetical protein
MGSQDFRNFPIQRLVKLIESRVDDLVQQSRRRDLIGSIIER